MENSVTLGTIEYLWKVRHVVHDGKAIESFNHVENDGKAIENFVTLDTIG